MEKYCKIVCTCGKEEGAYLWEVTNMKEMIFLSDAGAELAKYCSVNMEMLDSCIGIYIPSTQNVYTPIDNKEETELVQARFSLWFGGYSTYVINGGYRGKAGNVITEETTLIRSYCTAECLREKICDVFELASFLQKKMKQESIAIEVNGAMILMY